MQVTGRAAFGVKCILEHQNTVAVQRADLEGNVANTETPIFAILVFTGGDAQDRRNIRVSLQYAVHKSSIQITWLLILDTPSLYSILVKYIPFSRLSRNAHHQISQAVLQLVPAPGGSRAHA